MNSRNPNKIAFSMADNCAAIGRKNQLVTRVRGFGEAQAEISPFFLKYGPFTGFAKLVKF